MDQDDLFLFSKKAKVKTIGYKAVKGKFKLTAEDKGKYLLGAVSARKTSIALTTSPPSTSPSPHFNQQGRFALLLNSCQPLPWAH